MTVYLDCAATTPVEAEVLDIVMHYMRDEFGNAGSRTHEFGARGKQAVEHARGQVAKVVACGKDEVLFTSGATESNNLALLGIAAHGEQTERKHIISTSIEHKAVLEPLDYLKGRGFEITLIAPDSSGRINADHILAAVRPDTLLVSVMHANNETGIIQPIEEIAAGIPATVLLHVDAAQTFGKLNTPLQNARIDLISISGHKIFGPKGVGALISRRRNGTRPALKPLMFGGGQERGLRPGTQPVHLLAGLGMASEIALRDHAKRLQSCLLSREEILIGLACLGAAINGNPEYSLPHIVNVSFNGIDSEAAIVALKGIVAISNGSACTSSSYEPSHVLVAMGIDQKTIESALRFSWCHLTESADWNTVSKRLGILT